MPAIHSALYDSARSPWLQFAARPKISQVKAETGFSPDTLDVLWDKYEEHLPKRRRDQNARRMYFYFVFRYLHFYPTWEQAATVLWTPDLVAQKGCGISARTLHNNVLTYLAALALVIDEVRWEDRLDPYNHVQLLPTRFTCIVDTGPVFVAESMDGSTASLTFQPKYKENCFKMQVVISLTGQIVLYTGLHWGVTPDNLIWRWTTDDHPLLPHELVLGDGIYEGSGWRAAAR